MVTGTLSRTSDGVIRLGKKRLGRSASDRGTMPNSRRPSSSLDIWSEALRHRVNASIKAYALKRAGMPSEGEHYWPDETDEDKCPPSEGERADL